MSRGDRTQRREKQDLRISADRIGAKADRVSVPVPLQCACFHGPQGSAWHRMMRPTLDWSPCVGMGSHRTPRGGAPAGRRSVADPDRDRIARRAPVFRPGARIAQSTHGRPLSICVTSLLLRSWFAVAGRACLDVPDSVGTGRARFERAQGLLTNVRAGVTLPTPTSSGVRAHRSKILS